MEIKVEINGKTFDIVLKQSGDFEQDENGHWLDEREYNYQIYDNEKACYYSLGGGDGIADFAEAGAMAMSRIIDELESED